MKNQIKLFGAAFLGGIMSITAMYFVPQNKSNNENTAAYSTTK